jgi:cytochrome b6-f complex iron-sulfur subunit
MSDREQFDQALEKLLADQSPIQEVSGLNDEEQRMLRMAQLLRGSTDQGPRAEFVSRLHHRLMPAGRRVSRRTAILSTLSALAAGVVAGFGLERAIGPPLAPPQVPLVGASGRWMPVAELADLPEGAIKPFTAGAVQGFLVNRGGQIRALSRICTHMGCLLRFSHGEQAFVCPCHGAEFNLDGQLRYGPDKYGQTLPPLPSIDVRIRGQVVEVRSV